MPIVYHTWYLLLIDAVLVPADSLINGTMITLCDARELDELEFFDINLAHHDVIYAEGACCETLLGVDENAANFAKYFHRAGPPANEEVPCAPKLGLMSGRKGLYSRFRSALSPWIDCRQQVDIIPDRAEERHRFFATNGNYRSLFRRWMSRGGGNPGAQGDRTISQTSAGLFYFFFNCRGGDGRPAGVVSNNGPEPRSLQDGE